MFGFRVIIEYSVYGWVDMWSDYLYMGIGLL